nr:RNA-binding protein [Methanohalophilus levihalophilus]
MKIKGRVQLRKSDRKKLLDDLEKRFKGLESLEDSRLETIKADGTPVLLVDGQPLFFQESNVWFPTVKGVLEYGLDRYSVVVDKGAVRFVVNGADIMCPGIVSADPGVSEGDLVIIKEEGHNKPLAIGKALMDGPEMVADSGKAIKSLHYVGDSLWNLEI